MTFTATTDVGLVRHQARRVPVRADHRAQVGARDDGREAEPIDRVAVVAVEVVGAVDRIVATAVRELFGSGSVALGQQARLHVERHYAWDTVVTSLLRHYHAVLGSQWPLTAHG